jgi:hypothetical protein
VVDGLVDRTLCSGRIGSHECVVAVLAGWDHEKAVGDALLTTERERCRYDVRSLPMRYPRSTQELGSSGTAPAIGVT